jgi:hypothetical protein
VSWEGAQIPTAHHVPAGRDRFRGEREVFGSRVIDIKVSALDTNGGLAVCELIDVHKGAQRGTCTTSRKSGSPSSRARM